jgi:formylglycine-generating enzyme required for sulfatase activity
MAEIPGGCFDMGDAFSEGEGNELPVHNICISVFEMDVHEVTNAEYGMCVLDGACTPPTGPSSTTRPYGNSDYNDFPVIGLAWSQADDYCTWAGKRLPTEAEWEYAARGGLAGKRYPWGDTIDCDDANYGRSTLTGAEIVDDECLDYGGLDNDTHAVGNYPANGYGLYDMAGNANEWVNDWYDPDYYSVSPTNDPPGPASGTYRVHRGGSWMLGRGHLRVASRSLLYLPIPIPGIDFQSGGFRCARGGAFGS